MIFFMFSARSERYHHLASDEDEETNDEESSLEIRQFASWSHRFSKVKTWTYHDHDFKLKCTLFMICAHKKHFSEDSL